MNDADLEELMALIRGWAWGKWRRFQPVVVNVATGVLNFMANTTIVMKGPTSPSEESTLPSGFSRVTIDGGLLASFDEANNNVAYNAATGTFTVENVSGSVTIGGSATSRDDHIDAPAKTVPSANDAILVARVATESAAGGATFWNSGIMLRQSVEPGSVYVYAAKLSDIGTTIKERSGTDSAASSPATPHSTDQGVPQWWMLRLDRAVPSLKIYFSALADPGDDPDVNWEFISERQDDWMASGDLLAMLVATPNDGNDAGGSVLSTFDSVDFDVAADLDHSVPADEPSFGVTQGAVSNLAIVPGVRGWGYDTFGGSGRHGGGTTVLIVDSAAASSTQTGTNRGTYEWCVTRPFPREIIFATSGMPTYPSGVAKKIIIDSPHCTIHFETAPSPGFHTYGAMHIVDANHVAAIMPSWFRGDSFEQGDADALQIGRSGSNIQKIFFVNPTFAFAQDDNFSIHAAGGSSAVVTDVGFWNTISAYGFENGSVLAGWGFGCLGQTHPDSSAVQRWSFARTLYVHNKGRNPHIVGAYVDISNTLMFNCQSGTQIRNKGAVQATAARWNIRSNGYIKGSSTANSANNAVCLLSSSVAPANFLHVANTVWDSGLSAVSGTGFRDASSHGQTVSGTPAANVSPEGLVIRPIGSGAAGQNNSTLLVFAQVMAEHVGARPLDRLSLISDVVQHPVNKLDGVGPTGESWNRSTSSPSDLGWPITVATNPINHFAAGAHGGDPAPPSSTWGDIMASGYTRGEEWCHRRYFELMPDGAEL